MANEQRLLFGFSYHRLPGTDRWRPGGSTLARVGADEEWHGPGTRLAHQGKTIVWIDVAAEQAPDQDIDDLSKACEAQAEAEFRKYYPQAQLPGPR